MIDHPLSFCDVIRRHPSFFTFISENSSATSSWLDHFLYSNPQLVSQIKILYGDTLHDHIPICCEISSPCITSETNLHDQHSEKYHIKLENISDDQKTLCIDNLDVLPIEIWAHVLSCKLPFCEDHSHHRHLDNIYTVLVENNHVSTIPLDKRTKHCSRQILGWNWYRRDLYADGGKPFLNWFRNGRPRNNDFFEAMKTSPAAFRNTLKFCWRKELFLKRDFLL